MKRSLSSQSISNEKKPRYLTEKVESVSDALNECLAQFDEVLNLRKEIFREKSVKIVNCARKAEQLMVAHAKENEELVTEKLVFFKSLNYKHLSYREQKTRFCLREIKFWSEKFHH